jgi:hypothetical protein
LLQLTHHAEGIGEIFVLLPIDDAGDSWSEKRPCLFSPAIKVEEVTEAGRTPEIPGARLLSPSYL